MAVRGELVAPAAITDTALMTVEGELDDISGLGQTRAAHDLCTGIPADRKRHLTVDGRRPLRHLQRPALARDVYPRLRDFIAAADAAAAAARVAPPRPCYNAPGEDPRRGPRGRG